MSFPEWLPETHRPFGPNQRPRSRLVDPLLRPIVRFLHIEAAGGFLLLACTVVALVLANSAWSDWFAGIWQTLLGFSFGAFRTQ
jgi:NhaA family Na+:H+ antiporter